MKQKIYILGVVTALIIFTGTIFKVNHFPGAGILLTIGVATLVLFFLPVALINNYKADQNKQNLSLYIVTYLTCFILFTAMLFKIQHWPGAGILLTVALPFPYIVFLPVFLWVTSKNKSFNIYNTVYVLLLLALNSVFSSLLALNVAKSKIEDSYNLSRNYNKLETVLEQFPERNQQSSVNMKIDEILKIVNEYQDLILKQEGISSEQWEIKAGNLCRPDSRQAAEMALLESGETFPGEKLEKALKGLFLEFQKSPRYENLAKAAPAIFDYMEGDSKELPWASRIFRENTLSWSLIYLDGLEVNLRMIKNQVNTGN